MYPHWPWWVSATIFWAGTVAIGISIIEALHLYRLVGRAFAIMIDVLIAVAVVTGVCYFRPSTIGPCSAPLEVESLGSFLLKINRQFTTTKPRIKIVVDMGRKDSCNYARDLVTAFRIGGWEPEPIQEDGLIGNGVWLHGSAGDEELFEVYDQLWRSQPIRISFDPSSKVPSRYWTFWIKDTWPTPIQANGLTK
jgi:hypothetical protein